TPPKVDHLLSSAIPQIATEADLHDAMKKLEAAQSTLEQQAEGKLPGKMDNPSRYSKLALILLVPFAFLHSGMYGVAPAALQQVAPNEMRAQISAMYLFVVNLVGLGVGPMPNAAGLTWLGPRRVLFSEISTGVHMGIVTATEDRTGYRQL